MKYLCLVYQEGEAWRSVTAPDRCTLLKAAPTSGGAAGEAITLRFAGGRVSITDRPLADAKQKLSGVMVLEARDLNHAIQLMSRLPCTDAGGWLEIRPVNEDLTSNE
jgi:YCII-related domain-containing protein